MATAHKLLSVGYEDSNEKPARRLYTITVLYDGLPITIRLPHLDAEKLISSVNNIWKQNAKP